MLKEHENPIDENNLDWGQHTLIDSNIEFKDSQVNPSLLWSMDRQRITSWQNINNFSYQLWLGLCSLGQYINTKAIGLVSYFYQNTGTKPFDDERKAEHNTILNSKNNGLIL